MTPDVDYYEVLGVSRDADAREIKRAFLKKARELHPDVNDSPDAEDRFKEVNEAYSVLSDERKRQNYDQFGDPDGPSGFGGSGDYVDMSDLFGGFGMGDIFSSFFGGGMGGSYGRSVRTRGRDMAMTLTITLEEAAAGCTKTIAYDRLAPCDDCQGSGCAEGGSVVDCPVCHGTGVTVTVQRTILGTRQVQSTCSRCQGIGRIVDKPCETCQGQGRAPSREKTEIEIPAGVRSGQQVVVRGCGEAGLRGDAAGDLIVRIDVADHDRYQRSGDDLVCLEHIDAFQAMLGCTLSFEGILEGETVVVEVPSGAQNGQRVRVPGRGMPRMSSGVRGDLICVLDVRIPTDLSPEHKALLADILSERASEDARFTGSAHADAEAFGADGGKQASGAKHAASHKASSKRKKRK
ncbi:MAG: DnaJ domain-containing protein [Atopobiaceae bacterium]|nr:DnaJ domain-containing protein [Atopobiaceae bacterium]